MGRKKFILKKRGRDVDIASLSSGEKQIVFRGAFLLRNQQSAKGSVILIDEPEISLHPIWQEKIYDYYRKSFYRNFWETNVTDVYGYSFTICIEFGG